jgi:hypothetical protein
VIDDYISSRKVKHAVLHNRLAKKRIKQREEAIFLVRQ